MSGVFWVIQGYHLDTSSKLILRGAFSMQQHQWKVRIYKVIQFVKWKRFEKNNADRKDASYLLSYWSCSNKSKSSFTCSANLFLNFTFWPRYLLRSLLEGKDVKKDWESAKTVEERYLFKSLVVVNDLSCSENLL